ncbi:hypothetical protein B0A48_04420 [Cryoendolithus antarcticus]|uniref:HTH APSES-type domain-containing protein n=1 Tax=Cryoendolithus antarcticus TaxID=1507870 RepID=A0A1V8TFK3_9PEZI|nr:hypothetical protein B0A48_04420 [Cryoendolithus antarcticus]
MLTINALLNPEISECRETICTSQPLTPAPTTEPSTPASTPQSATFSAATSARRPKLTKDAAVFARGAPQGQVKYDTFECTSESICLTHSQQEELTQQHERFYVFPSGQGDAGLIREYVRHIPYSSEKKCFFDKTGREAFEVFQYTFSVPDDPDRRTHVVMWDYQIGLVRITPFFKSCKNFTKTTPAKALNANRGLRDLSHSITGGALAAQGYWIPYACARALCLTFAYEIRWALTPIFGHSFIKECLRPEHSDYRSFKINPEIVRNAELEAESWKATASRCGTPVSATFAGSKAMPPTSAPQESQMARPKRERPTFKSGSLFGSGGGRSSFGYQDDDNDVDSPSLSPKSSPVFIAPKQSSGWATINRPRRLLPAPPHNSPTSGTFASYASSMLSTGTTSKHHPSSWRDLNGSPAPNHAAKRRAADLDEDYDDDLASPSSSSTGSANGHVITSPPPSPVEPQPKRLRQTPASNSKLSSGEEQTSMRVDAQDMRAANWLLQLSVQDTHLGRGPSAEEKTAGKRMLKGKDRRSVA